MELPAGQSWQSLGVSGEELFDIPSLGEDLQPGAMLTVVARGAAGSKKQFDCRVRIDTPVELEYYRNGGILPFVLKQLAAR